MELNSNHIDILRRLEKKHKLSEQYKTLTQWLGKQYVKGDPQDIADLIERGLIEPQTERTVTTAYRITERGLQALRQYPDVPKITERDIYAALIACCYALVEDDLSASKPLFKYGWRSIEQLKERGCNAAVVEELRESVFLDYREIGIEAFPVYKITIRGMEWLTHYQESE